MTRRVVIAGGAGHIGRRLAAALVERGEEVIVLSRDPDGATRRGPVAGCLERWSASDPAALAGLIDDADAVVGLTGVPVGPRPWTARRRQAIRASRLGPTRAIVNAIRTLPPARRPRVLVSVSGTDGYEGRDQVPATEATPSGHGFLGRLCEEWEAAASEAEPLGVRVVIARIGFVLAPDATVMRLFALPFRFFLGGPLGTGRQWFSWIHVDDVVGLLMLAIDDPRAQGTDHRGLAGAGARGRGRRGDRGGPTSTVVAINAGGVDPAGHAGIVDPCPREPADRAVAGCRARVPVPMDGHAGGHGRCVRPLKADESRDRPRERFAG